MANFEQAIPVILGHEGGYVNNPRDPGGATNFGVSLVWLKAQGQVLGDFNHDGDVNAEDIKTMSQADACQIYKTRWWDRYNYGTINDQKIATKVFDFAVNMGPVQAHKILQRALIQCDQQVTLDGQLGPGTLGAVNRTDARHLLDALREQAAKFYHGLVLKRPNLECFLQGWLARAYS
jgi:lysozyme family protein